MPEKVGEEEENEGLRRYVNKHKFYLDFTPYAGLGHAFMARVAEATCKLLNKYNVEYGRPTQYYAIRFILGWLTDNLQAMFPETAEKLRNNLSITEKEWQVAINAFRERFLDPTVEGRITTQSETGKDSNLYSIRKFLNTLAQQGVTPKVTLKTIPKADSKQRPKRGLAERPREVTLAKDVEDILDKILETDIGGSPITKAQREDYLKTVYSEGIDTGTSNVVVLDSLIEINNKRLVDLRHAMQEELQHGYAMFKRGEILIDKCEINYQDNILPAFIAYLEGRRTKTNSNKATVLGKMFRRDLGEEELLGRLLTLIVGRWNGIVPKNNREHQRDLGSFLSDKADIANSSISRLRELLGGTVIPLIAAYTIILVDTGKNPSDIANLDYNCLENTDDPGIKKLLSRKTRINKKPHETFLNLEDGNKISAVRAIEMVQEMTKRVRDVAAGCTNSCYAKTKNKEIEKKLFLHTCRNKNHIVVGFATMNAARQLRKICNRHETLRGIYLTFDCIRPSVMLKRFFEGDLDASIAQSELAHVNKKPTTGYVLRFASKVVLEREMRSFQRQFEAVMIADIPGAAQKLGYAPDEFENILATALRNGLGCVCLRRLGRKTEAEAPTSAKPCDIVEDCNNCKDMRIAVASKLNLVDAILLDRHLERNHEEMAGINKERFNSVWIPIWARAKATLELARTAPGVSRQLLGEAESMANEIGAILPPLF